MRWLRPILLGGLVAGAIDLADAMLVFGLRGIAPFRILQAIASGWLGMAAFQGGNQTALLGLFFHFLIATGAAATYVLASRRFAVLRTRPIAAGLLFGLLVYGFMNLVVLPLSAARSGGDSLLLQLNGIAVHMVGVGLPIAWITSKYRPQSDPMLR
ncbi:hypothetical protein [Bryobacter aggregatus]|uniref:hypothetical protein n=1 Tax=Bryobacter aggregatus TaxID=360054 RepID=UPI0004E20CC3|nr:hypothetical protein [Bryobacter aggregatus]